MFVLALVPTVLSVPQPSAALDVGGLAFTGTAHLPNFPCTISTVCPATFTGLASGQVGGEQFGPWEATLTGAEVSGENIVYQDTNCVIGTAGGHVTVNAGLGQMTGEYKPNGSTATSPLPILAITIDVDFIWHRAGSTAAVVFANGVVKATIAGMPNPMVVMTGALGGSAAAFHAHINPEDPPDCNPTNIPPTNTPAIDADVVGVTTLVDQNVA